MISNKLLELKLSSYQIKLDFLEEILQNELKKEFYKRDLNVLNFVDIEKRKYLFAKNEICDIKSGDDI